VTLTAAHTVTGGAIAGAADCLLNFSVVGTHCGEASVTVDGGSISGAAIDVSATSTVTPDSFNVLLPDSSADISLKNGASISGTGIVTLASSSTVTVNASETLPVAVTGGSSASLRVENSSISGSAAVTLSSSATFNSTAISGADAAHIDDGTTDAAVAVAILTSTARTHITGTSALGAIGDLTIKAINKTDVTTTGNADIGGVVGAGIAITHVTEITEAFIESTGAISAANIILSADSDNAVKTEAKASPGGATKNEKTPNERTTNPGTGTGNAKTSDGNVALAGALAFTYLNAPTEAHISSTGLTVTTAGDLTIHAESKNTSSAEANGTAVTSGSTGVGVAVAVNIADLGVKSFASGIATLDAAKLTIEALIPATATFSAKSTSGAKGGETDVAGSLAVNVATVLVEASIASAASLTLNGGGTDIEIKAESTTENKVIAKAKVSGGGDTTGFGASIGINIDDLTTESRIDDGVALLNAKGLTLLAKTTDTMTNEVEGGTANGTSITPVVAVSIPTVETAASIGSGSLLALGTGALSVTADQTATSTTKAKGAAQGDIAIGAALALNMTDDTALASVARDITADGSVTIATLQHSVSSAQADASAKGAKKDGATAPKVDGQTQTQRDKGDQTATDNGAKGSGGKTTPQPTTTDGDGNTVKVSVAAAIAINMAGSTAKASIADGVTVNAGGALKISSSANTDAKAKSDGSAKITTGEDDEASFAIGVAVSVNSVDVINDASIGTGSATGSTITVEAVMKDVSGDTTHKYEAESTSGASSGKVGIAGAFSGSFVTSATSATVKGSITTNSGDLSITATNEEEVDAKATAKETGAETAGVGASISVNHLTNTVRTSVDGATVISSGLVTIKSDSTSEIKARTLSGAIAKKPSGGGGGETETSTSTEENGGGLIGAGAGAGSQNDITSTVVAEIVSASNVSATEVIVEAENGGEIQAIAGALSAVSASAKKGKDDGTNTFVLGASLAINLITNITRAVIDASTVASTGAVGVDADQSAKILAITIAAAGALNTNSGDGESGFAFQLAAAGSWNEIDTTTEAFIRNGSTVSSGGAADVTVHATDSSDISADGGAAALARVSGSSVSVGASIAINDITTNTTAAIDGSLVTSDKHLDVKAAGHQKIFALTIAAAVTNTAGSKSEDSKAYNFNLAGAVSVNTITSNTKARIVNAGTVPAPVETANSGDVLVTAEDKSEINADAGGAAASISQTERSGVEVGAAIVINTIDSNALAEIDSSIIISDRDVLVTATSDPDIFALALGIALGLSTGKSSNSGYSFDLAGSVAYNDISDSAMAIIDDSAVTAARDVVVSASDTSKILAITGAGSVLIGSSSGAAVGASISINDISNTVTAEILNGSMVIADRNGTIQASSVADIDAWAIAGAGSVSKGDTDSTAVRFAGAGAVTVNTISNTVLARILNSTLIASNGGIMISANDASTIDAISGALAFVVTANNETTLDFSVAAAVGINDISNSTMSSGFNSTLTAATAAQDVALSADSTSTIFSLAIGIAGTVSTGTGSGISFAGAGSGTSNDINNTVTAILSGGTTTAGGDLSVTASDNSTIEADAGGVAVALSRGPPVLAIGLSVAINQITNTASALLAGPMTLIVGNVNVSATSNYLIDVLTIAVSASVGISQDNASFGLAGAGAGSGNKVTNTIESRVTDLTTTGITGNLSVSATEEGTINADAGGGALALNISQGGSSGGAAVGAAAATNQITNTVTASIANSDIDVGGDITVEASSSPTIDTFTFGIAGTVSASQQSSFAFAAAGSGSGNTIRGSTIAEVVSTDLTAGGMIKVLAKDKTVITSDAGGVSVGLGISSNTSVTIGFGAAVAMNTITKTLRARVIDSEIHGAAGVEVRAEASTQSQALSVAGTGGVGVSSGGSSVGVSGAGALSINDPTRRS
jgi:hypothetical protein